MRITGLWLDGQTCELLNRVQGQPSPAAQRRLWWVAVSGAMCSGFKLLWLAIGTAWIRETPGGTWSMKMDLELLLLVMGFKQT